MHKQEYVHACRNLHFPGFLCFCSMKSSLRNVVWHQLRLPMISPQTHTYIHTESHDGISGSDGVCWRLISCDLWVSSTRWHHLPLCSPPRDWRSQTEPGSADQSEVGGEDGVRAQLIKEEGGGITWHRCQLLNKAVHTEWAHAACRHKLCALISFFTKFSWAFGTQVRQIKRCAIH